MARTNSKLGVQTAKVGGEGGTCDDINALSLVPLDEDVDGVLEGHWVEQQSCDVPEVDALQIPAQAWMHGPISMNAALIIGDQSAAKRVQWGPHRLGEVRNSADGCENQVRPRVS